MTPQLYHRWNDARDPSRGSNKEGVEILKETLQENKIILKQSRPR